MSLTIPDSWRELLAVPVAVFGGGVSGRAAARLVGKLGGSAVVYDEHGKTFSTRDAATHRLVIFSPGFAPSHRWLEWARSAGCRCRGELDFASVFWQGKILAITGTNGKTTLTEFLTHALRLAGRKAFATGNVGHAFSALVAEQEGGAAEDIAVCEVSSFQAEALEEMRPDWSIWTNFAEDHLERHGDMEKYFAAKLRLFERTRSGGKIANTTVAQIAQSIHVGFSDIEIINTAAEDLSFGPAVPEVPPHRRSFGLEGTVFADYPQRENFLLARAWWRARGMDDEKLLVAARTFVLGDHRLALAATVDGVNYWNDSKATNFHAVEAALGSFARPVLLIAGGKAKGGDLAGFVQRIARRVQHAFLIGDTAEVLGKLFGDAGVARTLCRDLAEAVRRAAALARPGDTVLLSPGFASFDQFRNYADRGESFVRFVQELSAKSSLTHPI